MILDFAVLTLHEFVGDNLDGDATQQECIEWCLSRAELPDNVRWAIMAIETTEPIQTPEIEKAD